MANGDRWRNEQDRYGLRGRPRPVAERGWLPRFRARRALRADYRSGGYGGEDRGFGGGPARAAGGANIRAAKAMGAAMAVVSGQHRRLGLRRDERRDFQQQPAEDTGPSATAAGTATIAVAGPVAAIGVRGDWSRGDWPFRLWPRGVRCPARPVSARDASAARSTATESYQARSGDYGRHGEDRGFWDRCFGRGVLLVRRS